MPAEHGLDLRLASATDPAPLFEDLPGAERVESKPLGEDRWQVRLYGEGELTAESLATLESSEAMLVELRRIEGTLEDVFIHLTGRDLR